MFTNLWLTNLYLAAHVLIILGLGAYFWLYFDLFRSEKQKHALYKAVAAGFLSLAFSLNLILAVATTQSLLVQSGTVVALQLVGLVFFTAGNFVEKVPGLPSSTKSETKSKDKDESKSRSRSDSKSKSERKKVSSFALIFMLVGGFLNVILGLMNIGRVIYKIKYGWSKEFKPFLMFWIFLSGYLLLQFLALLGSKYIWFELATAEFSFLWILSQIFLITAAVFMFRLINHFMSFRVFGRIFLYVWQFIVVGSVVLASFFSVFAISASESQIFELLDKNANLVNLNLKQIEENNEDVLGILSNDQSFQNAVKSKNVAEIERIVEAFLKSNNYLDQVLVVDNEGILLFDSSRRTVFGESISSNYVIRAALIKREDQKSFLVEEEIAETSDLVYQFAMPISLEEKQVGAVSTVKKLNDVYLDDLKKQTGQELITYIQGRRSASTLLEEDQVSRAQNAILSLNDMDRIYERGSMGFTKANILSVPYYVVEINLKNYNDEQIAKVLVLTEQSSLMMATKQTLFNTFLVSLVLNFMAILPSYLIARSIKKNLNA
jgi:hypothetical protein